MKNWFFRLCSTILVLALLVNMLPMSIFAEEFKEQLTMQDTVSLEKIEAEDAYVVAEVAEKRTEYTKEFLLSNGLHVATVYADPVHYEKDGKWEEIDNTLVAKSDGTLHNTAGVWDVSFPNQLSRSNSISIEKDGYTLSFSMAGELRSSGELMTAAMGTEATEQLAVSQMQAANASIQSVDTAALLKAYDYPETAPVKLGSQLRYNGVYANTDVVYDLQSDMVKESIVLDFYSSTLRGYRYTLNVGQMIPVLDEYGEIIFYAPDGKTAVMIMPAPYLLDANEAYNDEIQVQLTGEGSTYTLTYLLPRQWLAEEERAWPVILDPVIKASRDKLGMQDRTVAEKVTFAYNKTTIDAGYSAERGKIRGFFKYTQLPPLTSSDVVVDATFKLTKIQNNTVSKTVEVHKVTEYWDHKYITWDNQPEFVEDISDFAHIKNSGVYSWKITEIVRSWYTGDNYGLMIKMSNDVESGGSDYFRQFYSSDTGQYNRPTLQVIFKNNNGLESDWDYTSTSAGRAGTGSVNNFTGNLVWVRSDMGFGGNRMPVSISHVYNVNDAIVPEEIGDDVNNANNSGGNFFGLGIGWRTNYHERVFQWDCKNVSGDENYYVWEDSDGTDHYFKKSGTNTYEHEEDKTLILKTNGTGTEKFSITDKKGNVRNFDENGRLTKLKNNQATPSSIEISYVPGTVYEIDYITDGAGRKYDFTYVGGLLSKIEYLGTGSTALQSTTFTYENGQLKAITDHDGKVSSYTYNSNGILTNIEDFDDYEVTYKYTRPDVMPTPPEDETDTNEATGTEGDDPPPWEPPYLVDEVSVKHRGADGGKIEFEYGYNETRMTDHNGNVRIMQFNDYGNTVNIMDDEGHAQFLDYAANSHADTGKANQLTFSSKLQNTVANLLNHSSFETGNVWTAASGSTGTVSTAQKYYGAKSLLVKGTVHGPAFTIPDGQTYTLSVYVKASDSASIGFKVNGATVSHTAIPVGTDFVRYEVSYSNDTGSDVQATPFLFAGNTNGAYFDCAQLENMPTASRYNLVENGDFRYSDGWTKGSDCSSLDVYTTTEKPNPVAPQLGNTVFSMTGNRTKTKNISQTVKVSGSKGDSFVLAGWVAGYAVPQGTYDGDTRRFALRARFKYTDGKYSDYFYADFLPTIHGWQYTSTAMVATKAYSEITVGVVYHYNVNTIHLDGIQLFKEEFGASYTYDDKGNLVTSVDLQKKTTTYDYDENTGDLVQILEDNKAKVTYTYYENSHNVETATTGEGVVYGFEYDEFGNNTKVTIGSGDAKMSSEAHYYMDDNNNNNEKSVDGNYLEYTVDALGNITNYGYDPDTNTLEWVQYPNDTENTRTEYGYDDMFRKASEVCTTDEGANMSVSYTYENDYLKSVATPTTTYSFNYGAFGLRSSVQIGSNTLATYTYDEDYYPKRLDYGNGNHIEYKYEDGRKIKETYEDGDTVEYQYNNDGDLARIKDSATGRTTTQFYDLLGRPMKYEVAGDNYNHSVAYDYNADNNLTAQVEVLNGVTTTTAYDYDDDNRVTSVTTGNITVEYAYDVYGRNYQKITKTVTPDATVKTETFTYTPVNGGASSQIASHRIVSGSMDTTYSYTYDNNGNITSISDGTNTTSYEYDSANQLVRENNQEKNFTHTWEYDNAGNIKFRREYPYTTGSLTNVTANRTVPYGYPTVTNAENNTVWGDLLTSYDGRTIAYDNIGNPTSIEATEDGYERTYTWEHGRQLKTLYDGVDNWTYEYDANGMRTRRYCDWCGYQYIYSGSQLTQMKFEGSTLNFTYDASGTPLTMSIGDAVYYYVTNLQGDVVKLLDSAGNTVAAYTYDAWGVCTGETLSFVELYNPLRYRGYVYDVDTGLYYLQSRYYDPKIGRFLNADAFTSTGQGLLGNNVFTYCGNNPVSRQDSFGTMYTNVDACREGGTLYGSALPYVPNTSKKANCLGYVFGIDEDLEPCNNYADDFSLEKTVSGTYDIAAKYNITLRELDSYDDPIGPNEYRIVLKVGVHDYHYMVQHNDGSWSHKPGMASSKIFNGEDPGAVDWDLVHCDPMKLIYGNEEIETRRDIGYYNDGPIYFAVSRP